MASMTRWARPRLGLWLGFAVVLAAGGLAPGGSRAADGLHEFRGACYCRAKHELMCTPELTWRDCDHRCKLALCDDWFWKERLPCWNWGYGG